MNDLNTPSNATLRFGVFYDGGWFSGLWRYLAHSSDWQAAPSFLGVHDAVRWYLHLRHGLPLPAIDMACAHYVLGRPAPGERSADPSWDQLLARFGIVRHNALHANGHEQNADELLQMVAISQARANALDAVALITGDSDLLPAVRQLVRDGVTAIVPSIPEIIYSTDGRKRWIRTSPRLIDEATHAPDWRDLLCEALEPAYPLSYPFVHPVPGAQSRPAPDGYRYGTINSWETRQSHGFLTDRGGLSWFVDRSLLRATLPIGQPVRFRGDIRPTRGKKYPQVSSIQPYEPHGPIPSEKHRVLYCKVRD